MLERFIIVITEKINLIDISMCHYRKIVIYVLFFSAILNFRNVKPIPINLF